MTDSQGGGPERPHTRDKRAALKFLPTGWQGFHYFCEASHWKSFKGAALCVPHPEQVSWNSSTCSTCPEASGGQRLTTYKSNFTKDAETKPKWAVRVSSDQTCTLKNNVKQPKGIYFSGLQAKARLRIGGGGQTARAKPGTESIPLLDGVSEWKRKCLWSLFSLSACRVIPDVSSSMAHQSLKGSRFFRTDLLLCPPSLSTIHSTPARSLGVGRCRLSAHASDHLSGPSSVSPRLKLPCFLYSD